MGVGSCLGAAPEAPPSSREASHFRGVFQVRLLYYNKFTERGHSRPPAGLCTVQ